VITYLKIIMNKLEKYYPDDERARKIRDRVDFVRTEAMRCGNIVKNLLIFARGHQAHFQECAIGKIVERALQIVYHHIKLAKVEVVKQIDLHPEAIICDPDQLIQAFVALFINAVEAMPHGGTLEITVRNFENEKEWVLITVKDTGIGIPEELKDKILEPFFSTKKDKSGVGLGLSVVYGIIQKHRGKVWLESQEGVGTTFFIKLPVTPQDSRTSRLVSQDSEDKQ
jgi:two-component system NtrC family sensor kinase